MTFFIKYKNGGRNPLVINFAKSSCNCSSILYNKQPLEPNGADSLKVIFHAADESGIQTKTIIIGANTNPALSQIFFTANVVAE